MHEEKKEEDQDFMTYKETCSLCKGNGYITIVVEGKDEIKQCWLCESKGEKEYSQVEVDDFIYKTYYKKGGTNMLTVTQKKAAKLRSIKAMQLDQAN